VSALEALVRAAQEPDACLLLEALAAAELQTRIDRKYLVAPDAFVRLVADLADSHRVLEIDGRRTFRYESVYFDTPGLDS
jgi:hypothetical protein